MSFIARGTIGQQAGTGVILRPKGGMPAPRPPGGVPVDELPTAPSTPPRGPELIDPWKVNLLLLLTLFNVATNRYKDNKKDDDKDKCKIYSFKDKETECPNGRSHHIVPDRSLRSPGTRGQTSGKPLISTLVDAMLDDFLPGRGGGYYYADKMDEKKGQCICVSEGEHRAIHVVHDRLEKAHGETANPQWTATLDELENIGSTSVEKVTGCDKNKIKDTLRERHENLGLHKDLLLRADPHGQSGLSIEKFGEALLKKSKEIPGS